MPTHETFQLVRARQSRLQRMGSLIRSYWNGPLSSKSPELAKYFGGYGPTQSGVTVTEDTALTASPVWSAVTMISDDIASLPLHLYKRTSGGKDRYEAHPLYRLLHDAPNPEMDSMVMRRVMQTHALLWQNAYAEIERDGAGRPVAMWPLCPEYVSPFRDEGDALKYRYQGPNGRSAVIIDPIDMIHLVGHGRDGIVGSSMVEKARESFGMLLAAEKLGGSFYGHNMSLGGVIKYKGAKPPELSDKNYRETLEARHAGVERAYRILALYNDADYVPIGVKPNEGQFNETRIFQIREVARWFKMPPHKLGDLADATYSNVEQMDAAYMSSCIRPWLVLWQQQLSRKLISPLERTQQFIEHDTHGFLSVDAAGRSALYKAEFDVGSITPNDIRGYENRNRLEGGDEAFIQLAQIPLSRVGKWWDLLIEEKQATIEKLKQPPPPPSAPVDPNAAQKDEKIASQDKKIRELVDVSDGLKAALDEARATVVTVTAERDTALGRCESFRQQHDEAQAEVVHVRELLDGAQAALATEQAERQAESLAHGEALETLNGIRRAELAERDTTIAVLTTERDEARTAHSHAQELLDGATTALSAEQAERARELAERNAAIVERDDANGARIMAETEATLATQRAEQAERDLDIATQAQAAANTALEETRTREVARLTNVIAAHRGAMAHTMNRLVTRETENARRHKGTGQKLRAWMATFYDGHVDMVVDNILPIVRAHLAWMHSDEDPVRVARGLAETHVADSRTQLEDVLLVEDFNGNLERVLTRWEQQRPDLAADAFVREGVEYVRSYR